MAGPWEKYGGVPVAPQAAPQALPAEILGPPKVPDLPSGYEADPAKPGAIRPVPGGPADKQTINTPGDLTKTGDEYLSTLPPGLSGQVKALSEGRRAYPTGTALKDPKIQELIAAATQYDPTLDAANAATRVSTRKDFTSGVTARNITSLNTALGHLGTLKQAADGLENRSFPLWNTLANAAETAVGDPRVKNFTIARDAVANELMRVFRGAGSGSMQEIEEWKNTIDSADSPAQLHAAITQAVQLLDSRLQSLGDQYQRGMGQSKDPVTLLSPHAQEVYSALVGGAPPDAIDRTNTGNITPVAPGGTERTEPFPEASAFIDSMVASNAPYPVALKQYRDRFPDAPVFNPEQYGAALAYHRQHPNDNSGYGAATRTIPLSQAEQNNNALAQSAPVAFLGAAANGATAGLPVAAAGDQGQYYQAIQSQQHPDATFYGDLAGTTAGMIGGEAALGRAGMKAGLKRELIANSGYGAVRGGAENPDNPLGGAATGALAAGAGTVAGNALLRGGAAALMGVTNPDVNALAQAGVGPMTVGQIVGNSGRVGQFVKNIEDRLAGFAGPGTMINARRAEGYKTFNSKAFDKALEPINRSVNGAVGEEAVAKASDAVSQAFSSALKGKSALPDEQFIASARGPLERLSRNKRVGPEIVDAIEGATEGLFDPATGALSGENMQAFLQGLRQIREGYRQDPLYQTLIKPSLQGIEGAVEGMFKRQAPEVMPQYNAAKAAYRRLSILADAVDRGKQTEGVFTPSQLGIADRANAKKYDGKISAASGESPFFDLQRAGQNVLPGKVPDSGTAGRLAMLGVHASPVAVGAGLGYATGDTKGGAEAGLGLAGLLALIYTRGGQARLGKLLLDRSPRAQAAAAKLLRLAPVAGAGGAAIAQPNQ